MFYINSILWNLLSLSGLIYIVIFVNVPHVLENMCSAVIGHRILCLLDNVNHIAQIISVLIFPVLLITEIEFKISPCDYESMYFSFYFHQFLFYFESILSTNSIFLYLPHGLKRPLWKSHFITINVFCLSIVIAVLHYLCFV